MIDAARLLGFAFANADFLFEVDGTGTVVFATGAASDFVKGGDAVGKPAARLFAPSEAAKFATLTHALGKGDRAGPYRLKLVGGTDVTLAMFRLPQNGNQISCTLSRQVARPKVTSDAKTGLASRDGFLTAAAQIAGADDALAMVNVPGLPKLCADLGEEDSNKLLGRIGAALGKIGAKAAGRLSPSSFGVIADAVGGAAKLGERMRAALGESGAGMLAVEEVLVSLKGKDLSEGQRDLVVRHVVEKFASGQWSGDSPTDAATQFGKMMDETQQRLRLLTETVASGTFNLAYQPIVHLKNGETSHFEALARFSDGADTGEMMRFAEEIGVSDAFDLAVAVKILGIAEARASQGQHLAFNISGKTVCTPSNFGLLAGLLARKRALSSRVLIEITETAEITDMAAAGKAVDALRAMGYRVGIDDFGAGAASLNYLHALSVDFVKFDGALIKKIGQSKRDDVLLAGLVKLCGELGLETIAEYLERADQVAAAKAMGFDMGQGHYFGAAAAVLPPPVEVKVAAKRRGVRESWG
jgi:EAL domain-containing protein (putative c-di-GMP-specific phosphodiesterase class I)